MFIGLLGFGYSPFASVGLPVAGSVFGKKQPNVTNRSAPVALNTPLIRTHCVPITAGLPGLPEIAEVNTIGALAGLGIGNGLADTCIPNCRTENHDKEARLT